MASRTHPNRVVNHDDRMSASHQRNVSSNRDLRARSNAVINRERNVAVNRARNVEVNHNRNAVESRARKDLATNRERNVAVDRARNVEVNRDRNAAAFRARNNLAGNGGRNFAYYRGRNVAINNNFHSAAFRGQQYAAFRNYNRQWHDRGWWRSHYDRIVFVNSGWYYWNAGYWFPAWGYAASAYYAFDGPIYGYNGLAPDRVIVDVQSQLQRDGYYDGAVDGELGPMTREAIAAFQEDHGLAVTSVIDQPTLVTLGIA
ncbi:MAG TPA: peptidoglycan-binding protein [Candidatus Udaeobacter sp.]|nr:peptidoglycan-binding protein [Candidatus Udaeobacter sp.]